MSPTSGHCFEGQMTSTNHDWLTNALQLTAPECYVLQHGQEADGKWVFKLTLLELLTLQVFQRASGFLVPGPEFSRPLPPSLGTVRELYLAQPRATPAETDIPGVRVRDLAQAASQRFFGLNGYVIEAVMPVLVGRELYRPEEYKILFVINARRFLLTEKGTKVKFDLERSLMDGQRQFTTWVANEPVRALRFLNEMGSASLLLRPLYPEFRKLGTLPEFTIIGDDREKLVGLMELLREIGSGLLDDFAVIEAGVEEGATDQSSKPASS